MMNAGLGNVGFRANSYSQMNFGKAKEGQKSGGLKKAAQAAVLAGAAAAGAAGIAGDANADRYFTPQGVWAEQQAELQGILDEVSVPTNRRCAILREDTIDVNPSSMGDITRHTLRVPGYANEGGDHHYVTVHTDEQGGSTLQALRTRGYDVYDSVNGERVSTADLIPQLTYRCHDPNDDN